MGNTPHFTFFFFFPITKEFLFVSQDIAKVFHNKGKSLNEAVHQQRACIGKVTTKGSLKRVSAKLLSKP